MRFKYASESVQLDEPLKALGITDAFDAMRADFSGMTGRRDLSISAVLHKSFVEVDEARTEAAAATAVLIGGSGAPAPGVPITFDRPFLFLIFDEPTGQVLFLGRVVDPS